MGGRILIGISGWRYEPWRGVFYPDKLPQHSELKFASRMLPTIEINGSFYSLQSPAYYAQWHDDTPDDFVFAVKAPRYITHIRRLKDIDAPLANFFANGLFELKDKLGPILWQFAPQMPFKPERFEAFFEQLPHDTDAAAALAAHHDQRVAGRTSLQPARKRALRHAVEIRHESFNDPAFVALLRRHRIALVVADTAGKWPLLEDLTSDFVYVRLHGDKQLYASGYGDAALDRWGQRFLTWSEGGQASDARLASTRPGVKRARRDVYCYFDNDVKVHAPYDAAALIRKLGMHTPLGDMRHPAWPPGWQAPVIRGRVSAKAASPRGRAPSQAGPK
jgi:uncharacterized protein YecE (DUF72 family)